MSSVAYPKRLTRLRLGQRVRVLADDTGRSISALGTVVRERRGDFLAWVALDERQQDARCHPFPAADPSGRGTHVLANPFDCCAEEVAP